MGSRERMKHKRSKSDSQRVGQSVNQSVIQCKAGGTVIVDQGGDEGRPQESRSRERRMGMVLGFRHSPCHLSLATVLSQKLTGGSGEGWVTWLSSPAGTGCLLFTVHFPSRRTRVPQTSRGTFFFFCTFIQIIVLLYYQCDKDRFSKYLRWESVTSVQVTSESSSLSSPSSVKQVCSHCGDNYPIQVKSLLN